MQTAFQTFYVRCIHVAPHNCHAICNDICLQILQLIPAQWPSGKSWAREFDPQALLPQGEGG